MEGNGEAKSKLTAQRGGASILSLITVLAAFLLSSTYLMLAQAEARMSTRSLQSKQALYLAEAGAETGKACLDQNLEPEPSYALETGTFSLNIREQSPGFVILSEGRAGQAVKKIEVNLVKNSEGKWTTLAYREVFN